MQVYATLVSHQTSSPNFQYPGASPHPPLHLSGSLEAMGLFNEFLSKLICPCYVCMMGEHGIELSRIMWERVTRNWREHGD